MRMEEIAPKIHEDHIAGDEIPEAKAAVDKECEKLEKISAWNLAKVRNKSDVINEARKKGRESTLCVTDGSLSSQEC